MQLQTTPNHSSSSLAHQSCDASGVAEETPRGGGVLQEHSPRHQSRNHSTPKDLAGRPQRTTPLRVKPAALKELAAARPTGGPCTSSRPAGSPQGSGGQAPAYIYIYTPHRVKPAAPKELATARPTGGPTASSTGNAMAYYKRKDQHQPHMPQAVHIFCHDNGGHTTKKQHTREGGRGTSTSRATI